MSLRPASARGYGGRVSNTSLSVAGPVTETFTVPMGRYLGYVVVGVAGILLILALATHDSSSYGLGAFSIAFALLAWVVLIRPQVSAHANGLVMRNMVRDTFVPWASIRTCRVAATLQVGTGDKVYYGLGISKSARAANKERRALKKVAAGPTTIGFSPLKFMSTTTLDSNGPKDAVPRPNFLAQEYAINNNFLFAEQRIETLAKKGAAATADQRPKVVWDVLSSGALVLAVVLAVSVFVV